MQVGFTHRLTRPSERCIESVLFERLNVREQDLAPYSFEYPRHITSVGAVTLDAVSSGTGSGFNLAHEAGLRDFVSEIDSRIQPRRRKPLVLTVQDPFDVAGGYGVSCAIDEPYISETRGYIRSELSRVGVALPSDYSTHLRIGTARTKAEANRLLAAAESLDGIDVEYEPVDFYNGRYTRPTRPTLDNGLVRYFRET